MKKLKPHFYEGSSLAYPYSKIKLSDLLLNLK